MSVFFFILHWFYLSRQIALIGYILLYAVTDQAYLVPDSFRETVRNGDNDMIIGVT